MVYGASQVTNMHNLKANLELDELNPAILVVYQGQGQTAVILSRATGAQRSKC